MSADNVYHMPPTGAPVRTPLAPGGGGPNYPSMELLSYRVEQAEKHMVAMDDRLGRMEHTLSDIKLLLVAAPSKATIWGAAGTVIAIIVAVGALLLQASGNQLAAFQTGLSAVQAVVGANSPPSPPAPPPASAAPAQRVLPPIPAAKP